MSEEREKRKWWVSHEGIVAKLEGHRCAPQNPDYWYFPKIGYSMGEGHGVFGLRQDAVNHAIKELTEKISIAQQKLENLKQ